MVRWLHAEPESHRPRPATTGGFSRRRGKPGGLCGQGLDQGRQRPVGGLRRRTVEPLADDRSATAASRRFGDRGRRRTGLSHARRTDSHSPGPGDASLHFDGLLLLLGAARAADQRRDERTRLGGAGRCVVLAARTGGDDSQSAARPQLQRHRAHRARTRADGARGYRYLGGPHREARRLHLWRQLARVRRSERGLGVTHVRRRKGALGCQTVGSRRCLAELAGVHGLRLRSGLAAGLP